MWSVAMILLCASFSNGADVPEIMIVLTTEGICQPTVPPRIIVDREFCITLDNRQLINSAKCVNRFDTFHLAYYGYPDYTSSRLLNASMDMTYPWTCAFNVLLKNNKTIVATCTFTLNIVEDPDLQRYWVAVGVSCVLVSFLALTALGAAVRYMLLIQSHGRSAEPALESPDTRENDPDYECIRDSQVSIAEHIYEIPEIPCHLEFDVSERPPYPTPPKTFEGNQAYRHYETPYAKL